MTHKLDRMIHTMHAEGPHSGHNGTFHHLHIVALDHPDVDSHVKQLAAFAGQLTNHPSVFVTKEGVRGVEPWEIGNPAFNGGPAHPSAIMFQRPV